MRISSKRTNKFWVTIPDRNKLAAPSDSIANDYYTAGRIYRKEEAAQPIIKTTWFELGKYDRDSAMSEYCIVTPKYNTVLSVIWER
ncbi:MAG: hypothetical protein C5B59_18785 [Bacteroidetes bacterium]|nr:MAG: hypothetical protein C5B59_18785 [Bacteroidota bacterium]